MLVYITDFADQGVVLPMALALAVSLAAERWWRAAVGWSVAAGTVLGVMLTVKIVFAACGAIAAEGVRNPSGHTAVAALVAGAVAGVIARGPGRRLLVPVLAGLLAALAIGMTRVALGDHTVGDVIAATPVGVGGALLAVWLMGPPPVGLRLWRAVLPTLLVSVLMHGTHLRVEGAIQEFASSASESLSFCHVWIN